MKEKRFLLAIAALSLLATSCAEDINIFGKNDKSFQFKVTTDNGPAVKSGSDVWAIAEDSELEVGDMKLTLSATASYNRMDPFASINTKGTVLNNDNLAKVLQEFNLYIPMADIKNVTVAADDEGKWSIQPTSEGGVPVWPEEYHDKIDMPFIAYTGGDLDENDYNKFTYTSPAKASDQIDLLYAYTEANKNDVAIHFYHALAAVRFVVGGLKEDFEVTKISVKNVANGGTATYNGDGEFTWETSGSATFSQTYTKNAHRPASGALTYFDNDEVASTFFMVPQSVSDVMFEVMIKDANGNEYPVEASVPAPDGGWKAGYFYTYSISGGEGTVDIEVSEDFNNYKKENVQAHNTGKLSSYVRAAVVANWCNAAEKVVAPAALSLTLNSGWKEVGGFYYYSNPVAKDALSPMLFTNTIVPGEAPVAGTHLVVNVVMQAVEYDSNMASAKAAWTDDVVSAAGLVDPRATTNN